MSIVSMSMVQVVAVVQIIVQVQIIMQMQAISSAQSRSAALGFHAGMVAQQAPANSQGRFALPENLGRSPEPEVDFLHGFAGGFAA